jgi:nicotinamidase-related amidase
MKLRGDPDKLLFIVDPQDDFSDACEGRDNGSLSVAGSTADYTRIIDFLKNNDIQEVHVSLDTHSERHIAHPGFWQIWDGQDWRNAEDHNSALRQLSIDENGRIAGKSILDGTVCYFQPRNYNFTPEEYRQLRDYVLGYINVFYNAENLRLDKPMIWPYHCIEGSSGHRVAWELQEFLERWVTHGQDTGPWTKQRILRYHNKGRNNLVEMYSAFSADIPMTERQTRYFQKAAYDGGGTPTFEHNSIGHAQYENYSTNVNTELNVPVIEHLLRNNNHVYFCGEARTHCVKATLLDVMKVVAANPRKYSRQNVELLENMSSPIVGVTDDIAALMRNNGFSVSSPS